MLTTHVQSSLLATLDTYTMKCTHHKYDCNKPCLILLANYTLVTFDNYITTRENCNTQLITILKLMYNLDKYDHATVH
jgi:hypothetical protein